MSLRKSMILAATAACLAGGSASAQAPQPGNADVSTGYQSVGHRGHAGIHLSAEEKAMLKLNWHQQLKSMPSDQRNEAKQQLKQNWHSMDPRARQQQIAQLDSQWRSLPQSIRDTAMARLQQHAQRKQQKRQQSN